MCKGNLTDIKDQDRQLAMENRAMRAILDEAKGLLGVQVDDNITLAIALMKRSIAD